MCKFLNKYRGFTLIEVMVALAVFAIAASMLMLSDGNTIRQTRYMQEKVLSSQLADEILSETEVETEAPNRKDNTRGGNKFPDENKAQALSYGGRDWFIRQSELDTENERLKKVVVEIFSGSNQPEAGDTALISLTTYIRQPKKNNDKG